MEVNIMHKRSKAQIISQILEVCCEGANKTTIVYTTNSNSASINGYLKMLLKNRLVKISKNSYKTTSKGVEIMENLKMIQEALRDASIAPLRFEG
jgi:predicted transcriptional regulator